MRRESRVALRVEKCLHEYFTKAAEKKGLVFHDGVRAAMVLYVRKYTPSVVSKLEKGLEAAESLNEKRGRKSGTRIVDGKVLSPKEARKLAKAGKLKPKSEKKTLKMPKAKKTAKVAALKKKDTQATKATKAKKSVSLL